MVSSELALKLKFLEEGSKILFIVIDGVGGLPLPETGLTELETAFTPNLNRMASRGITGMSMPIAPGVAPGSGVAHLALFGYDPIVHAIGRGAVAAYGVGLDMEKDDVAVRVNFAGFSPKGEVMDRRAGRLLTEKNVKLCQLLREIKIPGVEIIIETVLDYRSVVVFKGEGLYPNLSDSDPQKVGENVFPFEVTASDEESKRTEEVAMIFIEKANEILKEGAKGIADLPDNQHVGILTRGYSGRPEIPCMKELYKLNRLGAFATYPDYRGIARIVGMDIAFTGHELEEQIDVFEKSIDKYDFFFFHVKKTDSAGEDGDFYKKVHLIEEFDALVPRLEKLDIDVKVITGDHCTPAILKAHSWHPVPFVLTGKNCRPDSIKGFSESQCQKGALGQFPATEAMLYALGLAGRIAKFGA
jgi:2,3-bisphosphoglycerate-independent phosphoglycerate mutase